MEEAANGVFLPANSASPNPSGAAIHSTLHRSDYYKAVNEALQRVSTRQGALEVLDEIRQALLAGGSP